MNIPQKFILKNWTVDIIHEHRGLEVTSNNVSMLWKQHLLDHHQEIWENRYDENSATLGIIVQAYDALAPHDPIDDLHLTICIAPVAANNAKLKEINQWIDSHSDVINGSFSVIARETADFGIPVILVEIELPFVEKMLRELSDMGVTPNEDGNRVFHISVPPETKLSHHKMMALYNSLPASENPDANKWRKA